MARQARNLYPTGSDITQFTSAVDRLVQVPDSQRYQHVVLQGVVLFRFTSVRGTAAQELRAPQYLEFEVGTFDDQGKYIGDLFKEIDVQGATIRWRPAKSWRTAAMRVAEIINTVSKAALRAARGAFVFQFATGLDFRNVKMTHGPGIAGFRQRRIATHVDIDLGAFTVLIQARQSLDVTITFSPFTGQEQSYRKTGVDLRDDAVAKAARDALDWMTEIEATWGAKAAMPENSVWRILHRQRPAGEVVAQTYDDALTQALARNPEWKDRDVVVMLDRMAGLRSFAQDAQWSAWNSPIGPLQVAVTAHLHPDDTAQLPTAMLTLLMRGQRIVIGDVTIRGTIRMVILRNRKVRLSVAGFKELAYAAGGAIPRKEQGPLGKALTQIAVQYLQSNPAFLRGVGERQAGIVELKLYEVAMEKEPPHPGVQPIADQLSVVRAPTLDGAVRKLLPAIAKGDSRRNKGWGLSPQKVVITTPQIENRYVVYHAVQGNVRSRDLLAALQAAR